MIFDSESVGGVVILNSQNEAARLQILETELTSPVRQPASVGELRDFDVTLRSSGFARQFDEMFENCGFTFAQTILLFDRFDLIANARRT